jgi:TFIIF-interacting CTD phosphatase-like protein
MVRRLYILDLDNCLIFSSYVELNGLDLISKRKYHYLYHRPDLMFFLSYLTKTGDILFYTSSKKDYAKWVVDSFKLKVDYQIFSRRFCKKRFTEFGEIYYKSIDFISLKKRYKKIIVIDDRIDLWLNNDSIEFFDISPFMGEKDDQILKLWILNRLKKQQKIS